jgi:hypothetical protein
MSCNREGNSFGITRHLPTTPLAIPPLWCLDFRPFFLGGTLFGVAGISLWLAVLMGKLPAWEPLGGWFGWHRHEMPFGFAVVIVAGFLLTTVQNWSGCPGLIRAVAKEMAAWFENHAATMDAALATHMRRVMADESPDRLNSACTDGNAVSVSGYYLTRFPEVSRISCQDWIMISLTPSGMGT